MKEKQLSFFGLERNEKNIILPKDILYFLSIIIILSISFAYIAGVYIGRKYSKKKYLSEKSLTLAKKDISSSCVFSKEVRDSSKEKEKVEKKVNQQGKKIILKKYVIQVATYRNKRLAQKEKKLLEKRGYPVILSRKGKYMVIFVGKFSTKEEAQKKLKYLKSRYKDCFIRRL
ncbi:MAG: hypothetical protein B6D56_02130 [Candidatus Omnitrophica bacterium 4484_70.1]|nr:MAG: hypothetical protein B6D56_02130 [Candidatus Omnitrophica bacterium 4484_70.1]